MEVSMRQEKIDRSTIEVILTPASGQITNADVHSASLIRQSLESVILAHMNPRTKIEIVIQVVRDDGSLRT